MAQLTTLHLADNGVGPEGAKAIAANMAQLTTLNLAGNRVGPEGAKAIAANMAQLTTLYLMKNGVGPEGASAIAAGLRQLIVLSLADNRLGDEGLKAILDANLSSSALAYLDLRQNSSTGGPFLAEILETTDARSILAAYRRFAATPNVPLNEVKLVVVGNEAVGK